MIECHIDRETTAGAGTETRMTETIDTAPDAMTDVAAALRETRMPVAANHDTIPAAAPPTGAAHARQPVEIATAHRRAAIVVDHALASGSASIAGYQEAVDAVSAAFRATATGETGVVVEAGKPGRPSALTTLAKTGFWSRIAMIRVSVIRTMIRAKIRTGTSGVMGGAHRGAAAGVGGVELSFDMIT
jgi:cell pole-organizing protein PopZ